MFGIEFETSNMKTVRRLVNSLKYKTVQTRISRLCHWDWRGTTLVDR